MKFFIDTANIEEIKKGLALGMVDGVTTNPSLILKAGRDIEEVTREICGLTSGPVSAEVVADKAEDIKTNVTLIFSVSQALLAAKAGAAYVSPFVGRLDDISVNGLDLIADIMTILRNYGFATEVIVASVRSPMHVVESALLGADIATIPYKVIAQLAKHPLTDIGMQQFLADWEKRQK